jgi:hypothetical protein
LNLRFPFLNFSKVLAEKSWWGLKNVNFKRASLDKRRALVLIMALQIRGSLTKNLHKLSEGEKIRSGKTR